MQKDLAPKWAQNLKYAWPPLNCKWGEVLPDVAVYDLEHQPSTFDFIAWYFAVSTLGAKHVRLCGVDFIQDWKYSRETALKRFENIVVGSCEMFKDLGGMDYSIGERCSGFTTSHHYGHLSLLHKKKPIKKLPMFKGFKGHVTISIRDSVRFKSRDSDRKEWEKVISELEKTEKVIVIEDGETEGKPMPVSERYKLYCGARMNLSVSNGPQALCHFSDAPYLTFKMVPDGEGGKELEDHMRRGGFPPESQLSFRNSDQELIWKQDTFENIMRAYERIGTEKAAA
jgi:hypothetical protein